MRILLFGDTSGIPQLLKHLDSSHVVGVVGAAIRPQYLEPLQQLARSLGVPFMVQPQIRSPGYEQFRNDVESSCPDLIWVSSYSMIVRPDILAIPFLGGINIHGALLPQYRGCNPLQWAILNHENETGVTLHEMSAGLDEGNIIDQRVVPLLFEDTWVTARDRIAVATDDLIEMNLPLILNGEWESKTQDESLAHYHPRRTPSDGAFAWQQPAHEIYDLMRALLPPLPGAFYQAQSGVKVFLKHYHTPAAITALKYGSEGGGGMEAERVRLRPLIREDAALLYEWITNRELVVLNAPFHPVSEVDHDAWIASMLVKRTDLVLFVIEEIETGLAIGTCQLVNINWRHRSAELQIRIGSALHQGKGLGSEAVRLLTKFGFQDLNLHRIYLNVFASNQRAIKAYQKCGFQPEGLLREAVFIDGRWVDVVAMAVLVDADE